MNSILVVQLKWLGDVILTTPALDALRKSYPKAQITLLIDHIPPSSRRRLRTLTKSGFTRGKLRSGFGWIWSGEDSIFASISPAMIVRRS
jgi:hypothetical protein